MRIDNHCICHAQTIRCAVHHPRPNLLQGLPIVTYREANGAIAKRPSHTHDPCEGTIEPVSPKETAEGSRKFEHSGDAEPA